ncbi:hypothetical protein M9980_13810 [Sphingomonas donggukensis]|uniref:Fimbrial biogenesis outer membrane usher protein n=1 Tax=Sphingomonas donggukensis TaxID=2949093 RepID=A0ABY4TUP8_9SPHN|nr:hypothetical protein [Sphingomonas donggukensis]URW75580.1 hypothetical protein M9980_13810 [Sphingomonas donggukensis]
MAAAAGIAGAGTASPRLMVDPAPLAGDERVTAPGPPPRSGAVTPADAQDAPAPRSIVPRGQVDILAPLLVNDRLVGEIDVKADAAGSGDIDAARLAALLGGLLDPELRAGLTARIAGRARVPLDGLSVDPMTIVYDPATLEVRVTLPPARMLSQTVSFRGSETPEPGRYMPQARYAGGVALGATQRFIESGPNTGRAPLLLSADGFLTVGRFPGVTLQSGGLFTEVPGGRYTFERAQTRVSYDDFGKAIHYVAGEFNPALTGFQGGARMLGIGVARDYAGIRPFENIRPSGRGGITLERPSTVIVEVNGIETRRLQLDSGRYQLTDLSAASGANDVRLFVQDDLGRREVASAAFFTATAMLAPGLTDFGFALGRRESVRTVYGGPLTATGYVRRGIGGNLTLGAGGQYAAGDWQTNGEAVVGTPLGLFRLQGSASNVAGRAGHAVSLDWLHSFDRGGTSWSFTVLSTLFSRDFASPFDRLGRVNDNKWRIDARADWRRGPLSLALTSTLARNRSRTEEQRIELTGYYSRGRVAFSGGGGFEKLGTNGWRPRALLGISVQLGQRTTASIRADTRRGAVVGEISRYPLDQVGDVSGRVQLVREHDRIGLAGDARYFGNRFIAGLEQSLFYAQNPNGIGTRETIVRASTFVGIADGSIALGRPTTGNFAIYDRHRSLKGAAITVRDESGLVVARQDWLGAPIAPFNRVFSPVLQTYEVDPVPTGYDLGESRLSAFPGAFSGYRVPVGSDASRVAIGYLIGPDGPIATMSGVVERIGGPKSEPRPFFTNAAGRFAVDSLEPGTYRMMIGTTEVARFAIGSKSEGLVDVGKLSAKAIPQ